MRIIKHGKLFETGEIICHNCGCVFTCSDADIFTLFSGAVDTHNYVYISCPECQCHNYLEIRKE